MKIQLKLDTKSMKRRSYFLNPKYKEKVCKELDRMLDVRIIVLVEELEWISPMVVQPKKIGDISFWINLCSLNASYVHYPFPTSFTDEVMENVGG